MADETPTAAPVTASPAVEPAPPVVAAVAPAPVVETPIAPVVETPAPEAAPVAEPAQPEPVKTEEPPKPLLDPDAQKTPEEAKVDAPKEEPAALPTYEFKLPEGASADNPAFKSFQGKLGEFQNLSKADQAVVQKFGQDMIDMHLEDMKSVVESQNKASWDWFNNRNKEWLDTAKADPQIGGDNFNTTVGDASRAISLYGGTKTQQIETAKLLQETGLENSPIMLRFLSNITKIAAKEGKPVTGSNAPGKQTFNPAQALFGGTQKTA